MELKSHAQGGVKPTNNTCTKGGLALCPESGWTGKAQANIEGVGRRSGKRLRQLRLVRLG